MVETQGYVVRLLASDVPFHAQQFIRLPDIVGGFPAIAIERGIDSTQMDGFVGRRFLRQIRTVPRSDR